MLQGFQQKPTFELVEGHIPGRRSVIEQLPHQMYEQDERKA